jgi:hypothetical protein
MISIQLLVLCADGIEEMGVAESFLNLIGLISGISFQLRSAIIINQ